MIKDMICLLYTSFTPEEVAQMALYHDVGKVEIAQQIWTMPCRLAPEEYALMTAHTFLGARILLNTLLLPAAKTQSGLEFRAAIADCCLCHHERWDGTGYPLGLAGESIPYLARLVAIADAYEDVYKRQIRWWTKSRDITISTSHCPVNGRVFITVSFRIMTIAWSFCPACFFH